MKRMSFDELEAICEKQGCRFNELFLIGEHVFVMLDAKNSRLPKKYCPLLPDDSGLLEALPEILRRLSATEFPSMEVYKSQVRYESALYSEFEELKYQLYDLLAAHTGKPPEDDDLYLDLEGLGAAELHLVCRDASAIGAELVAKIKALLSSCRLELPWSVKVLEGSESRHVFSINEEGLMRAS